ncbi:restriction endonuclease subunit S [Acidovorax facilis]|uniref:restriction endonuclease subunit S n=1 Tax=Acidovorax facilis TaxID=12917 RepID=UPI003CECB644
MSSEWTQSTLGEFVRLQRGHDLTASEQQAGSIPIMGSAGPNGTHSEALAHGPGVVIGRSGASAGRVHFSEVDYWPHNTCLYVTDFLGNNPRFAYYLLQTLDLAAFNSGSAQPSLNRNYLYSISLKIPPRAAQDGIVDVLKSLDDRITLLRETNATLEAIAQALFKSWFVDFDPVRAKMEGRAPKGMDEATTALFPDALEAAADGEIPAGWHMQPIRELVADVFDGPHATPPEADAGPVFLGIKNLTGTGLALADIRHINEDDWLKWTKRVVPQAGDIVFSYEATLGFFALIPSGLRCCLGRRLALIRPKANEGAGHFWFHQFTAAPFQRLLVKHTVPGATVNRIALKEFPSYHVLVPPVALQMAFDTVASALWAKIHENQAQAQTLSTLRDTLLPRLISGQLRLPEAQATTEAAVGGALQA